MKIGFATKLEDLGKSRGLDVPTNLIPKLSKTSLDTDCFVKQKFSSELQVFLINYVFNTTSYYNLNG